MVAYETWVITYWKCILELLTTLYRLYKALILYIVSGIMGWLPSTSEVEKTIWVSTKKRSEENVEKFKARCVYGGRQQE